MAGRSTRAAAARAQLQALVATALAELPRRRRLACMSSFVRGNAQRQARQSFYLRLTMLQESAYFHGLRRDTREVKYAGAAVRSNQSSPERLSTGLSLLNRSECAQCC